MKYELLENLIESLQCYSCGAVPGPNEEQRNRYFCFQNSPFFQRYEIDLKEAILGDGSFSVCRRCVDRKTGTEYAVKIVSKRVDCSSEIRLLKQCQGHTNVVQLVDVLQVLNSFGCWAAFERVSWSVITFRDAVLNMGIR